MKNRLFHVGIIALLLIAIVFVTPNLPLGVAGMTKTNADYPSKSIDFDDYLDRNQDDVKPEPRLFIPPSEESLKLTQEQVQSFDCNTVEDVSVLECEALVALYASTNGAGWSDNTNWLQTPNVGLWRGVEVIYGELRSLSLESNNLVGVLPTEIGNLKDLRSLFLPLNFLSGSIPKEIFQLEELRGLYLFDNQLSGSIPLDESFSPVISIIELENNLLTGQIPSTLSQTNKLWHLNLSNNQLTGSIPSSIGALNELTELELSSNQLSGKISSTLGNLRNLKKLWIDNNLLTGSIPAELGNLRDLYYLRLQNNRLSGSIPPELGSLNWLRELRLDNNLLSGAIPHEMQNERLENLNLSNNQLSGEIPPETKNLYSLTNLMLSNNQLSGEIPGGLFYKSNLLTVDLEGNQLSGSIPAGVEDASSIKSLNLSRNQLSGTIPAEMGTLTNLVSLNLANNRIEGTIPAEMGAMTSLITLNLANNRIEGAIPESFTNLVNLDQSTDLGYNRLNVPQEEPVQSFLNEKDPDWHLTQAIQSTISCDLGGEIISRNNKVKITIRAEACSGDVDFLLAPFSEPGFAYDGMHWAENGFDLSAWHSQGEIKQFQKPLGFTLFYTDESLGPLPEEQLAVLMFDEDYSVWRDAVYTCPDGEYARELDENSISLPVCHLTAFGLFNKPETPLRLYFPMGLK